MVVVVRVCVCLCVVCVCVGGVTLQHARNVYVMYVMYVIISRNTPT